MEGVLSQRMSPLLKCIILFLFIFTAKVLTSQPQESTDSRNNIHHLKPSHYVRTFTKYHHRRTNQWNSMHDTGYWPVYDHPKHIGKRSVPSSNELNASDRDLNQLVSDSVRGNIIGVSDKTGVKEEIPNEVKKYKPKVTTTTGPTTQTNITCLYKIHNVALSVTPSYNDDKNAQLVVENEIFDTGTLSETTLPDGEVVQVEQCTDPRAYCYTLWHQDNEGNITVLGQGCWRSSHGGNNCDKCTRVTARLPGSKFCCCTKSNCNADFTSLREETVTIKAESTMESAATHPNYSSAVAAAILALVAILLMAIVFRKVYCNRIELDKDEMSDGVDLEKGDVMGSGPDALATGLSCVDNITLIEHIGQGKFGSVWRGSLGSTPVAVKLYTNPSAWHKEAAIYAIPHLAHPNILRYYGSDSRPSLTDTGGRSHLLVLELCPMSLRERLIQAPVTWLEFATLAHGLASALAHLHTPSGSKPCIPRAKPGRASSIEMNGYTLRFQTLVCRNKARPPLPRAAPGEARALKIAADTCEECWDHDAEARLTAVCVEERMAELKLMLLVQGPVIHDNNLHPNQPETNTQITPNDVDKNSNCVPLQNGDVTTPLLYPHPHIGRNACIERNTNTNTQTHTVELIHKSLKDITAPAEPKPQSVTENCLSVARISHNRLQTQENSDRLNEIRSYQRPLDYVQNDVSAPEERGPKQTNLLQEQKDKKWGIRKFFEKKLNKTPKETEVKLVAENITQNGRTKTSVVDKPSNIDFDRPTNLGIQDRPYNFEAPCTLSPPNKTLSPTMLMESDMNTVFRELPARDNNERNQVFAVIVPKVKPESNQNKIKGSSESLNKRSVRTSMSSQSMKAGHSESEDSTLKKRLSCDNPITNSAGSSRASINLELQYLPNQTDAFNNDSPFDMNSDCSSSEDEHLMLLSENNGAKITIQTVAKPSEMDKKKHQNEVLKEASHTKTDFTFNKFQNKYTNFDNEFSDSNDKENLVNGYSGDNPVYIAALNGEIDTSELKILDEGQKKPSLKSLAIKRQHSLEQVNEIFSSSGDLHLQNPAGRVKTPGDLPVAIRRARRDRALQKGRASESNRLSLYDDRMMFGNSL
ncbi:uncharacterized protein LOC119836358 [Zerene cesonia]|uniref:uncharacterized protein LOC119836358 n=1 Tax=Zerene cesonia TaxID=33412 RepID=UPI0018E58103|nr:uncharacterized protein LOC119836358 [Zerene cesonia]